MKTAANPKWLKQVDKKFDLNGKGKIFMKGKVIEQVSGNATVTGLDLLNMIADAKAKIAELEEAITNMTRIFTGQGGDEE